MIKTIEYEIKPIYFTLIEKRKKYRVKNLNMAKMYLHPGVGIFFCGFVNYIIEDGICYLKYFYLNKKYRGEGKGKLLIWLFENIIKKHYLNYYKTKKTNRIFKKKFISIIIDVTRSKNVNSFHYFLEENNYESDAVIGEITYYEKKIRLKKLKTKK